MSGPGATAPGEKERNGEGQDPAARLIEALTEAQRHVGQLQLERDRANRHIDDLTQRLASAEEQIDALRRSLIIAQEQPVSSPEEPATAQEQIGLLAGNGSQARASDKTAAYRSRWTSWRPASWTRLSHGARAGVVGLLACLVIGVSVSTLSQRSGIAAQSANGVQPTLNMVRSTPVNTARSFASTASSTHSTVSAQSTPHTTRNTAAENLALKRNVRLAAAKPKRHKGSPRTTDRYSRLTTGSRTAQVTQADAVCRTIQTHLTVRFLSTHPSKAQLKEHGAYLAKHWLLAIRKGLSRFDVLHMRSHQRRAWNHYRHAFHAWLAAFRRQVQAEQAGNIHAYWITARRVVSLAKAVDTDAGKARLDDCAML